MTRIARNKTFLDRDVAKDVIRQDPSTLSPSDLAAYESLNGILIPYEAKITKAKEGTRDKTKYMLFCTENLRIYDTVDQYLQDRKELVHNTKQLENRIAEMMVLNSDSQVDFLDDGNGF